MSIVMLIAGVVLGGAFAAALLLGRLRTEHELRLAAEASHASQLELLDASRTQLRDEMKGISAAVLEKTAESLTRELARNGGSRASARPARWASARPSCGAWSSR